MERRRFEYLLTNPVSRRRFLGAGLAVAATAISWPGAPTRAAGTASGARVVARPVLGGNPFTLGVASGDPLPDSVVLWTRLAPDPGNGGGMDPEPVAVRWEVAEDEAFATVVASGGATATPELAHSVHADVTGLRPGRPYFYRFMVGDEISPVGRTKTAPAAGAPLDRFRFAMASCAHFEHGYFGAYRHLAEEDVDLAVFLGDYVYEYAANGEFRGGDAPVRLVTGEETVTLEGYRARHALYKADPDLQAAHAALPWLLTWDDHEVDNDYAGERSEQDDPVGEFLARRAAAYQAFYEHMPLRPESMPRGPEMRLYRRLVFGDLAEFHALDTRQYRSDQACERVGPRCEAALDPARTLTGEEQEAWLLDGLGASGARWNVIAQQVMMGQLDAEPDPELQAFNMDQWDGYPLARQRLLDHLQAAGTRNPVVLTGDVHSAWVHDLKLDFDDPDSPAVGTEFVTTSITSFNPFARELVFLLPSNPHITYYDAQHGYARCELTPDLWRTDFRAVSSVETADAEVATIASFVVEDGKAGAVKG